MLTDEQLLANYGRGDQAAFAELIRRYQPELFAFLQRFVADGATAEDLFQETFVQVHRNARSFDPQRRFRPWLFTIAANKARDFLRSHGRRTLQSLDRSTGSDEDATAFVDLMASDTATPPVELSAAEDIAAVQEVLEELSPLYKQVLTMSFFNGFAYKEMAEMLEVPLGTVKSRLHAAVAAFAKAYEKRAKTKK